MQHSQAPGPEHRSLTEEEMTQRSAMWAVRDTGDAFLQLLESLGSSRELSLAKTKVEEAVMWATKGITGSPQPTFAEPSIRRLLLDIFDRIAAAIAAKSSGDTSALEAHVAAIDQHLQQVDASDADEQTRLGNIEAGLAKVADAVNPPAPAGTDTTGAASDGTDTTGAGTGTDTGGQPADPTA